MSERWQQEVAETVFETINADTDKIEQKKKNKPRIDEMEENCKLYEIHLTYQSKRQISI